MKRIVSILLCFALLIPVLALSSCHGKSAMPEFRMPEDFDDSRQYDIVFWAKNENHKEQQEVYRSAVERFEALYPNINVTLKMYADYNLIYRDVITNIGTGTTPNVCITYPDHIATYNVGDNIVVPLDALMADPEFGLGGSALKYDGVTKDEIVGAFLDEGKLGGEQYALPFMRSTEACYVNVDLVRALGFEMPEVLTWDFVWAVCDKAMIPTGVGEDGKDVYINGQSLLIPFIYKSVDNMMIQYLEQAGADYSTDKGDILFFNDTSREFLSTLAEKAESGAFTTFNVDGYPGNYLNRGQCIFAVDSTAGATWMGPEAPHLEVSEESLVSFEMAVTEIPQLDPDNPRMISQGPSVCIFNKEDPDEVVASWLFAQFLLTNETQIGYAMTEGYLPVTTVAYDDPAYIDYTSRAGEASDDGLYYFAKIEAAELLLRNIDNTFVTPVFNGSTSVRNAAGDMINSVVKATRRNQPTDAAAIEAMYARVVTQYHLDQIDIGRQNSDLGELPGGSVALIVALSVIWVGLAAVFALPMILKRKKSR